MSDPDISLVVPAYNEGEVIGRSLAEIGRYAATRPWTYELLVVDDGSTDDTRAVLEREQSPHLRVLGSATNHGKGHAVRLGVANSIGGCVVFFDADLSYPLSAIDDALVRLRAGADVVVGARDLAKTNERSLLRAAATRVFNEAVERALRLGVPDTQCGFKAFAREVAVPLFAVLRSTGFTFDVELLWVARHWGLRLERMPLGMRHASSTAVNLVRDSMRMLRDVALLVGRENRGDIPPRPAELTSPRGALRGSSGSAR